MDGRIFVAVDDASLSEALAQAGARDEIVVADGAFDAAPELERTSEGWRIAERRRVEDRRRERAAAGARATYEVLKERFDLAVIGLGGGRLT